MRAIWQGPILAAAVLGLAACTHPLGLPSAPAASDQPPAAGACPLHTAREHGATPAAIDDRLSREIVEFQLLAEHLLALRAEMIAAGGKISTGVAEGRAATAEEFSALDRGFRDGLGLRQRILQIATSHECWLAGEAATDLPGLTPPLRLKGVMLSLSAALLLYDNYLLSVALFEQEPGTRRYLNERDPGADIRRGELSRITRSYHDSGNRSRVRAAIAYYEGELRRVSAATLEGPGIAYLHLLIQQSPSYRRIRDASPLSALGRRLGLLEAVTGDTLDVLSRDGVNLFSMLFGNTMGLVETRRGKLYRRPELAAELRGLLRPGDILLEKTPFRLTDKLIPGYWGHAALWIGGEPELRPLGIWGDPLVGRHRESLAAGRQVAEALRPGVQLNSLEHFLNIDDLGILRRRDLGAPAAARVVLEALRQVGKPYDFTFTIDTRERIYCSKLVYIAHGDIAWPTRQSLGRTAFVPDDLALYAARGGPLDLVALYHRGEPVTQGARELFSRLLAR